MPGILLFMVDQLAARWLESPAVDCVALPNIARLRARGTSFRRCISSNPVCCPARATLATGLTSRQHGVLQNGYALDPAIPTFMHALQGAGWRTGAFGKLHFQPHFAGLHPDYRGYGFDTCHITEDGRGGEWLDWIMAEHPAHLDAVLATVWAAGIPEFAAYGPDRLDLRARIAAVRAGFDWRTPGCPDANAGRHPLPFPEALSQTAWITDHARRWLAALATSSAPAAAAPPAAPGWFAQVSYVQPHGPFGTPERCLAGVAAAAIPEPAAAEWPADPDAPHCFDRLPSAQRQVPADWRSTRRYYFADLIHLDEQLGLLLDDLDASGASADTTVILLADHGEMLQDHGFRSKGEFHYDACIRVPLILAGPRIAAGAERSELVQLEDLYPTILDLAGIEPPAPRVLGPYLKATPQPCTGRSLLPLCAATGPDPVAVAAWRQTAYAESYNNIDSLDPSHWARTLVTQRHRYTWYPGGAGEQLFDLAADPAEQRNLVRDPAAAALREGLRSALLEQVVLQDYPHPPRARFALGVH